MGPAFFPTLLGGLLALLGIAILARGLRGRDESIGAFPLRPLLLLPLALLTFALLVRPLGLVVAAMALVVVSALGGFEFRLREAFALGAGLALVVVAVFVRLLGLPFKVWPV